MELQTGFGRTGAVIGKQQLKQEHFTAVNGEGYFINTTSGAFTMTFTIRSLVQEQL